MYLILIILKVLFQIFDNVLKDFNYYKTSLVLGHLKKWITDNILLSKLFFLLTFLK